MIRAQKETKAAKVAKGKVEIYVYDSDSQTDRRRECVLLWICITKHLVWTSFPLSVAVSVIVINIHA